MAAFWNDSVIAHRDKERTLVSDFRHFRARDPHCNKDGDFRKRDWTDPITGRWTETRPASGPISAVAKEMAHENATVTFANLVPKRAQLSL
jgi:hypothetical protein